MTINNIIDKMLGLYEARTGIRYHSVLNIQACARNFNALSLNRSVYSQYTSPIQIGDFVLEITCNEPVSEFQVFSIKPSFKIRFPNNQQLQESTNESTKKQSNDLIFRTASEELFSCEEFQQAASLFNRSMYFFFKKES